jgi:hypothetical protein
MLAPLALAGMVVSLAMPAPNADVPLVDQLTHQYAPAAQVTCDPQIDPADYGLTFIPGGPIELAPAVCLGAFFYTQTPDWLYWFQYLHPDIDVEWDIAIGVVVTLHEAQHAAGYLPEWQAQCRAMRYAKPLLAGDPAAWSYALEYNAELPPAYHSTEACP